MGDYVDNLYRRASEGRSLGIGSVIGGGIGRNKSEGNKEIGNSNFRSFAGVGLFGNFLWYSAMASLACLRLDTGSQVCL